MTDLQIIKMIIQEGKRLAVEFKEHFTPRIAEDMAAFANQGGRKGVEEGVENLSVNEKTIYGLIRKNPSISKEAMAAEGNLIKKTVNLYEEETIPIYQDLASFSGFE